MFHPPTIYSSPTSVKIKICSCKGVSNFRATSLYSLAEVTLSISRCLSLFLLTMQVGQLTWTIVTICMIVAQVKFIAHNIFNGIFWFFFPASLVICNDISAYFW